MDYAEYLAREQDRMARETRFYYTKFVAILGQRGPVLDIGCGPGNFLALAGEHSLRVHGVDMLSRNASYCRARGLSAVAGSVVSLPVTTASAGGILVAHVLEHLTRDELLAAASEIERVLRPGGVAVVVVPRPRNLWRFYDDPTHVSPMTEQRISLLFHRFTKVSFVNYYIPWIKGLLTVRYRLDSAYERLLQLIPFRARTSITAICVK